MSETLTLICPKKKKNMLMDATLNSILTAKR